MMEMKYATKAEYRLRHGVYRRVSGLAIVKKLVLIHVSV